MVVGKDWCKLEFLDSVPGLRLLTRLQLVKEQSISLVPGLIPTRRLHFSLFRQLYPATVHSYAIVAGLSGKALVFDHFRFLSFLVH